jgi:flagellar basal-body rod protein FlgB
MSSREVKGVRAVNLQVETRLSDQLERFLDLTVSATKLTAANMANIDTPGYQTLGFNFGAEMSDATARLDSGAATRPVHMLAVDGLIARPDGNNVSMDREGLQLAEEQLKFKSGVALMRLENQRILDAIHADK